MIDRRLENLVIEIADQLILSRSDYFDLRASHEELPSVWFRAPAKDGHKKNANPTHSRASNAANNRLRTIAET
jgi:hypothetical protein